MHMPFLLSYRLIVVILPNRGHVMSLVESYFDESCRDDFPVLCVAGYIFHSDEAKELSWKWNQVLQRFDLPYFRMVSCAHGNKPFKHLELCDRIQVQTEMIDLIKTHAALGMAVTVDVSAFNSLVPKHMPASDPYSFAALTILGAVGIWMTRHEFSGDSNYFYEAGHQHQSKTQLIMERFFSDEDSERTFRYTGHAFIKKIGNPPIQAADLLAWQWYTDRRHILEGRRRRKDCESLLGMEHMFRHVGRNDILGFLSGYLRYLREMDMLPPKLNNPLVISLIDNLLPPSSR
jgi:hypothetical protein